MTSPPTRGKLNVDAAVTRAAGPRTDFRPTLAVIGLDCTGFALGRLCSLLVRWLFTPAAD